MNKHGRPTRAGEVRRQAGAVAPAGAPRPRRAGRITTCLAHTDRAVDRVAFTTGAMRAEPDRRHLTLPVIGTARTQENTRRLERLIAEGRARVLAITVRRNGTRLDASMRVLVTRPIQPRVACPDSQVGVGVGVRRLATVAQHRESRLHRRVNDVRAHHLHVLTTRLAKTHGRIVGEGLDAAGMLRQKGLPGARARRRGLF